MGRAACGSLAGLMCVSTSGESGSNRRNARAAAAPAPPRPLSVGATSGAPSKRRRASRSSLLPDARNAQRPKGKSRSQRSQGRAGCRESVTGSDYTMNGPDARMRMVAPTQPTLESRRRPMKYMLMMNTPGGGPYQIASWPHEGHQGAHRVHDGRSPRSSPPRASWSAAEGLAGPDQAKLRARRQGRQADHRRRVPRVEGVPRRLLDRRRREPRARVRDRRRGVGRARAGRRAAEHGDRGPPGDERAAAGLAADA